MAKLIPEVLHPIRGDSLTSLERQLWRFRMVTLEIQVMLRGFFSTKDLAAEIPEDLLFSLVNHGQILLAKFLEVWDDFGSLARDSQRVVFARRAVNPFMRRIGVWPGLEQFRNTVLAHAYETKDGRLVGPWHLMHTHQTPTYHAEIILLLHCAMYASGGILAAFYSEYKDLGASLRADAPEPDQGPGIREGSMIRESLKPLLQETDANLQAGGVPAANPVFAEFRAELQPRTLHDGSAS